MLKLYQMVDGYINQNLTQFVDVAKFVPVAKTITGPISIACDDFFRKSSDHRLRCYYLELTSHLLPSSEDAGARA